MAIPMGRRLQNIPANQFKENRDRPVYLYLREFLLKYYSLVAAHPRAGCRRRLRKTLLLYADVPLGYSTI